jgi:hypothetical protein
MRPAYFPTPMGWAVAPLSLLVDSTVPCSQPLTGILKGHEITSAKRGVGCLAIRLSGGYDLLVVTSAKSPELPAPTGRIAEAWHEGETLKLEMEDGSSLRFRTAAPDYCVLVRSDAHGIEYAR